MSDDILNLQNPYLSYKQNMENIWIYFVCPSYFFVVCLVLLMI